MDSLKIALPKVEYSEWVVRHALYWIDEPFNLSSADNTWVISFDTYKGETEANLHQLLNDYKLREILDTKTGGTKSLTDLVIAQMTSLKT